MEYEFKCEVCEHEFMHTLKIIDRNIPLSKCCPRCRRINTVKRIYSSTCVMIDPELLKADKRMEESGVQQALERIREYNNPEMKWKG